MATLNMVTCPPPPQIKKTRADIKMHSSIFESKFIIITIKDLNFA